MTSHHLHVYLVLVDGGLGAEVAESPHLVPQVRDPLFLQLLELLHERIDPPDMANEYHIVNTVHNIYALCVNNAH